MDKSLPANADDSPVPSSFPCNQSQAQLADDAPLTRESLVAFLEKDGSHVGKCFMNWAVVHGISRHNARDAIQDVLAWIVSHTGNGDAATRHLELPLLFSSASRKAVRYHRQSNAIRPADQRPVGDAPRRHNPEEVYEAMKAALPTALEQLNERDRVLLVFCDAGGNPQADAAEMFEVLQGTISRWLNNARQRLHRLIIAELLCRGFDRSELPKIPL